MKLNTQFLFAALTAVTLITPACGGDAGKKTEEKKTEKTEVKADGTKTEVKTEEKKTDEKPADKAADPAQATPPAALAARKKFLPMRPNPLMPTRTVMCIPSSKVCAPAPCRGGRAAISPLEKVG